MIRKIFSSSQRALNMRLCCSLSLAVIALALVCSLLFQSALGFLFLPAVWLLIIQSLAWVIVEIWLSAIDGAVSSWARTIMPFSAIGHVCNNLTEQGGVCNTWVQWWKLDRCWSAARHADDTASGRLSAWPCIVAPIGACLMVYGFISVFQMGFSKNYTHQHWYGASLLCGIALLAMSLARALRTQ